MARQEGVALNQLINVAVAEKLSAMRTEQLLRERAARRVSLATLARIRQANPPDPGDELPG